MEDKKLLKVLELQQQGVKRGDIADKLYKGIHKNNLNSLNKYMFRRGYILKDNIYIVKGVQKMHMENTNKVQKDVDVILDKQYIKSSMWVMSTVWADWKKFTERNNHFKKQYLLSMALKEYMQNHK